MEHFIDNVKPTIEDSDGNFLILNGNITQTLTQKISNIIDCTRENGVRIVCLPPHTAHRLQPLHVSCTPYLIAAILKILKTGSSNTFFSV